MFRFPSASILKLALLEAFKRFPAAIIASVAGTFAMIRMIGLDYSVQDYYTELPRIAMASVPVLSLSVAFSSYCESRRVKPAMHYLMQAVALLTGVVFFLLLPPVNSMQEIDIARYLMLLFASHLLVSFSPFIGSSDHSSFWQFNKTLFLRFLLAALYSGVLYLGLALAMLAIDQLFKADIDGDRYGQLWFFIAGIFNTWFFLAGLPRSEGVVDKEYPRGLKIFTQFVLLPLVTVYLLILYAYLARILVTQELPRGWVSWLVIGFSVAGILSLLLVWPVRNQENNTWIRIYTKWYYRALFPLIGLLTYAIWVRIADYGVTENRYFIVVLDIWLLCTASYFLFSKSKNIKIIPVSLYFFCVLCSFGPWGAFSVSARSQAKRLENILIDKAILVDGKIRKSDPQLADSVSNDISSIIEDLEGGRALNRIQPWFNTDLDSLARYRSEGERYRSSIQSDILALMGVEEYYAGYQARDYFAIRTYYNPAATGVGGYDYYSQINLYQTSEETRYFGLNRLTFTQADNILFIKDREVNIASIDLEDKMQNIVSRAGDNAELMRSPAEMEWLYFGEKYGLRLRFTEISGSIESGKRKVESLQMSVLVKEYKGDAGSH